MIWEVIRSEHLIDPRKMDGEILVDAFFLRSMVPVVVSGHDQKFFEPFRIRTKIAMRPSRVKRNEDQVREDDRLRKSKHEWDENKTAHERVVHEVGP